MTERTRQSGDGPGSGLEPRLFPYALIRIAGGPHDAFQALEVSGASRALANLRRERSDLEALREELSADLYGAIGSATTDDALRHELLALRRSLFGTRGPDPETVVAMVPRLPREPGRRLARLAQAFRRVEALETEASRRFADESERSREQLRELARDPILRRGLAISSRSLLEAVDRYVLDGRDARPSRVRRAELGLIKYLARFYCKTSPLSTLTSVAVVTIPGTGGGPTRLVARGEPRSVVRLNNALGAYLKDRLRSLPDLRQDMPVSLAPFRRDAEGGYRLVTNLRNVDLFQRVSGNPAVDAVVQVAASLGDGATWSELLDRLEERVEGDRTRLERFLEELTACGLLRIGFRTPALDPDWEVSLSRELSELDAGEAPASTVRDLLTELHQLRATFAAADARGRQRVLQRAAMRVREVQEELDRATAHDGAPAQTGGLAAARPELEAESLVYEDCFLPLTAEVNRAELERVVSGLWALSAVLHRTNPFPARVYGLSRRLRRDLGADTRIPLLELSERRQRAARAKRDEDARRPVSTGEQVTVWRWGSWIDRLPQPSAEAEEVALSTDDVLEAAAEAGIELCRDDGPTPSRAAFVQLVPEASASGALRAVINFLAPGYGRMLSRFLHGARDGVVEALRDENRRLAGNQVYAEIRDGSSHAANVHPPLMPYEIMAPGGEARLPPACRILAEDLDVEAGDDGKVVLRHRASGRRVLPFDMDFLVESLRSRTYRLLLELSPMEELPLPPLVASLHRALLAGQSTKGVRTLPRIGFEDRVVLARRTWLVPRSELPRRLQTEDDWTFFRRVDDWRAEHSMPARVFLTLASGFDSPPADEESERLHPDDRKPQYVSFEDPYLVRLLGRLFERAPDLLVISEALPATHQLLDVDGAPTVTEWVLQWTG